MTSSTHSRFETLRNKAMPAADRTHAALGLGELSTDEAMTALLEAAQDDSEDEAVAHAAGEGLARILIQRGGVVDAPLHSFTGPAYLGFDDAVAAHQQLTGMALDERSAEATAP